MEIIPAIDLIGGKCVRLSMGDYASRKEYAASPVDMAKAFADCGVRRIHLVDLDAAKEGRPCNLATLEDIASAVDTTLEWGGGLSDDVALESAFSAGADCGIIGSLAVKRPDVFRAWLKRYGGDKIILGADVRGRNVAVRGWLDDGGITVGDLIASFTADGLSQVICTAIACDGMLGGPDLELYSELRAGFPSLSFTVSGGIGSPKDIEAVRAAGLSRVIVGKAIYEGYITLEDIAKWSQKE